MRFSAVQAPIFTPAHPAQISAFERKKMAKRMWLPAEIDDVMDQRMWNWGDWCRVPDFGGAHTSRGVEGKYRSQDDAQAEADQPAGYDATSPWAPVLDGQEAQRVHSVVMHPFFPELERKFLREYYVEKTRDGKICRDCGIRWVEYHRFKARVLIITRNRLTEAYPYIYKGNHNSPPAQAIRSALRTAAVGAVPVREKKTEALDA
jgi:hypothetical protein